MCETLHFKTALQFPGRTYTGLSWQAQCGNIKCVFRVVKSLCVIEPTQTSSFLSKSNFLFVKIVTTRRKHHPLLSLLFSAKRNSCIFARVNYFSSCSKSLCSPVCCFVSECFYKIVIYINKERGRKTESFTVSWWQFNFKLVHKRKRKFL